MSQYIRRILAAMSVTAALLLVVPAPSWAARAHRAAPEPSRSLVAQVWSWLGGLLGDAQKPSVQRKDIMTTPEPLPPPPNQGPMIDPDGVK
jgi:hypothetical protein